MMEIVVDVVFWDLVCRSSRIVWADACKFSEGNGDDLESC